MEELLKSKEIVQAQAQLDRELKDELPHLGQRNLGFRGGSKVLDFFSRGKGQLYYASVFLDGRGTTPRYWNAFGYYNGKAHGSQTIAVEINIPNPPSRRVAAFFARNNVTQDIFLLHDGRMGGGKEGVCRTGFLRHSQLALASIVSPTQPRQAVVVTKLGSRSLVSDIDSFARAVVAYKESVE